MNSEDIKMILCQMEEYRHYVEEDFGKLVKELFGENTQFAVSFKVYSDAEKISFQDAQELGWVFQEREGTEWVTTGIAGGSTTIFK